MLRKMMVCVVSVVLLVGGMSIAAEPLRGEQGKGKGEARQGQVQKGAGQRVDLVGQLIKAYKAGDKQKVGQLIGKIEQRREKVREGRGGGRKAGVGRGGWHKGAMVGGMAWHGRDMQARGRGWQGSGMRGGGGWQRGAIAGGMARWDRGRLGAGRMWNGARLGREGFGGSRRAAVCPRGFRGAGRGRNGSCGAWGRGQQWHARGPFGRGQGARGARGMRGKGRALPRIPEARFEWDW